MKKLNKKGFTLVELLAVIVILAVVMLIAVTAVGPLMTKSRKNAVMTEASTLVAAAKTAYMAEQLDTNSAVAKFTGATGFICMDLQYLVKHGYYDKAGASDYTGGVKLVVSGSSITYTVWLSNGTYKIANVGLPVKESDVSEGAGTATYASCGAAEAKNNVYCRAAGTCALKTS